MHERLLTLAKFYTYQGKGVQPFVFGKDVNKNCTRDDLNYIGKLQ
jgi:hypothetical protein